MPPPLRHALVGPAHPSWCPLVAPPCHQPASKTGIFDDGYGGTLGSTPSTDTRGHQPRCNGSNSKSVLEMAEGVHGGRAAENWSAVLEPRGESPSGGGELVWEDGTAATAINTEDGGEKRDLATLGGGVVKRGEIVQAIGWAAAIAGTKYIIMESFKAGGRQIYKAFHEGNTEGLKGTMFEKEPYQPHSWEMQAVEDEKEREKAGKVHEREGNAADKRRKLEVSGNVKRRVEDDGGSVEDEEDGEDDGVDGLQEETSKIEDVYFGDVLHEIRSGVKGL